MAKKRAVIGKLLLIGILSLTLLCSGALANEIKPAPTASAPSLCVPAASEGEADMAARLRALLESRDDDPVPPDMAARLRTLLESRDGDPVPPDMAARLRTLLESRDGDPVPPDMAARLRTLLESRDGDSVPPDMAARLRALLESRDDDPVPPGIRQRLEGMRKEARYIGGQRFGLGSDAAHIQRALQEILRTSAEDALAEAETSAEAIAKGCSHIWCDWEEDERLTGFTLEADQDCKFTHVDCSRCCTKCALIQCKSETYYEGHVWLGVAADAVDAAYMRCGVCGVQKPIQ